MSSNMRSDCSSIVRKNRPTGNTETQSRTESSAKINHA